MKIFFYFPILLLLGSCKPLAAKMILGVDITPEWKKNNEIEKDFAKYEIPPSNQFVLDTAVFKKNMMAEFYKTVEKLRLTGIDSTLKHKLEKSVNDNLQPVQVRYFDSLGLPIFKLVNCYVDNPYKMDWNVDKAFANYPPSIASEVLNYDNRELVFFLPMLLRLNGEKVAFSDLPKKKYYAIIFWNDFFKRPSRKLIKLIQEIENNNKDTFVFYVNNHNSEIYDLIPAESRAPILRVRIRNVFIRVRHQKPSVKNKFFLRTKTIFLFCTKFNFL
jgi:hypothetical protein